MRCLAALVLLLLTSVAALQAQDWCAPPRYPTVDAFKARLLERPRAGLVSVSLAPSPAPGCPTLPLDTDLNAVMDDLIRWSVRQGDSGLEATVVQGVRQALVRDRVRGRPPPTILIFQDPWHPAETLAPYRPPPLRVPLAALRFAVEHDAVNSIALIRHLAVEEPRVADLLIDLARAPEGPPSNPDLPANLVEVIFGFRQTGEAAIRAELADAPGLIRHPRARCLVERRPEECPRGG